MAEHRLHPYSLLPGSDWFLFGGVAIQADPCETCEGFGKALCECSNHVPGDTTNGCRLGCPCSKCRGLGVIPRVTDGAPEDGEPFVTDSTICGKPCRVLVVPIEGDE